MKLFALIVSACLIAFKLTGSGVEPVRLALVSDSDNLGPALDELTVELSGNSDIQLLERSEIEKVYREQGLSAANLDYLKLGRILGAEGLLIMSLGKEGEHERLKLRLVAVGPGVTLKQVQCPWPLAEQSEWAQVLISQLNPLFPKLQVLSKDAVPIFILNLRSAVASPEAEILERNLTRLLYARLTEEKDIFVLERRQLGLLREENELNENTSNSFWSGSYLLDGEIDRDGYQKEIMTLNLKLMPPGDKNALVLEASGPRANLPVVVNDLAVKVLAALKKNSDSLEWKPAAEAGRYNEEAQWMYKWRMFEEAKSAAETAWALGHQDPALEKLRIAATETCGGDPGQCVIIDAEQRVFFGGRMNSHITDFSELGAYAAGPTPAQFADVIHADEIFQDALHLYVIPEGKLDTSWLKQAVELLDRTSLWLRYYYFTVEARAGQEAQIDAAKQICLSLVTQLENLPNLAAVDQDNTLLKCEAQHYAFWVDAPEQCMPFYRKLINDGRWDKVRKRFLNTASMEMAFGAVHTTVYNGMDSGDDFVAKDPSANLANPTLAGWNWPQRERCPELWQSFIDGLCAATDPSVQLEGRILRCSDTWSAADFNHNFADLLEFMRKEHRAIAEAAPANVLDDLEVMLHQRTRNLSLEDAARFKLPAWQTFKSEFANLEEQDRREGAVSLRDLMKNPVWISATNYLNSQTNFEFMSFSQIVFNQEFQPGAARLLLPLVTNYAARVIHGNVAFKPKPGSITPQAMQQYVQDQQALTWVGFLEDKLTKAAYPSVNDKKPVLLTVPTVRHAAATAETVSSPSVVSSNLLVINRFWHVPLTNDNYLGQIPSQSPQIRSACYRDGRLWVEAWDANSQSGRAGFYGINLKTFSADQIEFQGDPYALFASGSFSRTCDFEIYRDFLYVSVGNVVRRFSFKNQTWEIFPVPAAGQVHPVRLAGRLFFTTPSSILEYLPDGSFRTLASSRRQPPETLLDEIPDYGTPLFTLASNSVLHVRVGKDVFACSPTDNIWSRAVQPVPLREYFPLDDGPDLTIFTAEWRRSHGPFSVLPSIDFCFHDDESWFLVNPPEFHAKNTSSPAIKTQVQSDPSLLCYDPKYQEPFEIPVRFETPETAGPNTPGITAPWLSEWTMIWTPEGLALFRKAMPGFWLVPADQLQAVALREETRLGQEQKTDEALHAQWRRELKLDGSPDREMMIDDPHYLTLELSHIDQNTNGLLDAAELSFFDANTNGRLEPQELHAIKMTISLLAEKMMHDLRLNQGHQLAPDDFPIPMRRYLAGEPWNGGYPMHYLNPADTDPESIKQGLSRLLQMCLYQEMAASRMGSSYFYRSNSPFPDAQFSSMVESYWHRSNPSVAVPVAPFKGSLSPL